jgi:hypothetical protein
MGLTRPEANQVMVEPVRALCAPGTPTYIIMCIIWL